MITYEVTATIDEALREEYEPYMREHHIPDVLATGWFVGASFGRAASGQYRIRYEARDAESLERYLARDAARLRADVQRRFPVGVELTRENWEVLQVWSGRTDDRDP